MSVVAQDLPVSLKPKNFNFFGKRWIFVRTERQFEEIPLLENLLISPNPSLKITVNHSAENENDWTYDISKNENYAATSDATKAG